MAESLKKQTLKGTLWSVIERFSVQGVGFMVMIVMARILTPADYGLVGELTLFIMIAQSLVDSGFSQALIRKQDRSEVDNSTVFYFNIIVGIFLYGVMFFCAPAIAKFYGEPPLIPLTRVICLSMVINSFVVVQRALLTVKLDFRTQAKASLSAALTSGVVGIAMAYLGFGVWALAGYQLTNLGVNMLLLWFYSRWRPSWLFSWSSFKELFSFGSKLAASGILGVIYQNSYLLIIGKLFKASDVGFYTRAFQFASFLPISATGVLQKVAYPVLCRMQDEDERLQQTCQKFLRFTGFIVFPLAFGLAALAVPLIVVVLKEKWEFAAYLLQILCFALMWDPIHRLNLLLLQVKGRSDLFLKLDIVKKCIFVVVIVVTAFIGLKAMCYGLVFNSLTEFVINSRYTGRFLGLGLWQQIRQLAPSLLYSAFMLCAIIATTFFFSSPLLKLAVGIPVGLISYFGIALLTGSHDLRDISRSMRSLHSV